MRRQGINCLLAAHLDSLHVSVSFSTEAVNNIISFLGMQPCERSDKVPENKNSHVLFLGGERTHSISDTHIPLFSISNEHMQVQYSTDYLQNCIIYFVELHFFKCVF